MCERARAKVLCACVCARAREIHRSELPTLHTHTHIRMLTFSQAARIAIYYDYYIETMKPTIVTGILGVWYLNGHKFIRLIRHL